MHTLRRARRCVASQAAQRDRKSHDYFGAVGWPRRKIRVVPSTPKFPQSPNYSCESHIGDLGDLRHCWLLPVLGIADAVLPPNGDDQFGFP